LAEVLRRLLRRAGISMKRLNQAHQHHPLVVRTLRIIVGARDRQSKEDEWKG
jgi:hypothetical protein